MRKTTSRVLLILICLFLTISASAEGAIDSSPASTLDWILEWITETISDLLGTDESNGSGTTQEIGPSPDPHG